MHGGDSKVGDNFLGSSPTDDETSLVSIGTCNDPHSPCPPPQPSEQLAQPRQDDDHDASSLNEEDDDSFDLSMMLEEDKMTTDENWEKRLSRMEVYNGECQMSPEEKKELKQLAIDLGLFHRNKSYYGGIMTQEDAGASSSSILGPETLLACNPDLRKLFSCDHPHHQDGQQQESDTIINEHDVQGQNAQVPTKQQSIVLKRGRITLNGALHELILLTHGFILVRVERAYRMMNGSWKTPLVYDRCVLYENVVRVTKDLRENNEGEDGACDCQQHGEGGGECKQPSPVLGLMFHGSSSSPSSTGAPRRRHRPSVSQIEFQCADIDERDLWLSAFRIVLTQDRINRTKKNSMGDDRFGIGGGGPAAFPYRRFSGPALLNMWSRAADADSQEEILFDNDGCDGACVTNPKKDESKCRSSSLGGISQGVQAMFESLATELRPSDDVF